MIWYTVGRVVGGTHTVTVKLCQLSQTYGFHSEGYRGRRFFSLGRLEGGAVERPVGLPVPCDELRVSRQRRSSRGVRDEAPCGAKPRPCGLLLVWYTAKHDTIMLLTKVGACFYLRMCGRGVAVSCARVRTLDSIHAVASVELRAVWTFFFCEMYQDMDCKRHQGFGCRVCFAN